MRFPKNFLFRPFWVQLFPSHFVINVATLGPIGQRLPAPGTFGSLAGLLFYILFLRNCSPIALFFLYCFLINLGIAFCTEVEFRLQKQDPSEVILDEFLSIPLVFIGITFPPHWFSKLVILSLAFVFFRLFDILKPLGINTLQKLPGGLGIMADDLLAALYSCACLHISLYALNHLHLL